MTKSLTARVSLLGAALVFTAAALTACSGTTGGTSASSTSGTTPQQNITDAQARVSQVSDAPSPFPNLEPLQKLPTGKKFVYVACSAPSCLANGPIMSDAAAVLGATVETIPGGATAQSISTAMDTALQDKPDVLIVNAIEPTLWTKQLAEFKAAGIPVVGWSMSTAPDGITWPFYTPETFAAQGATMADWVISTTNGSGRSVVFSPPQIGVLEASADGYVKQIGDKCPGCVTEKQDVPVTDLGTPAMASAIVSYLQKNPDTKNVVTVNDSMTLGVPQAIAAAGITGVKLSTIGGEPSTYQLVKSGGVSELYSTDLNLEAWAAVDGAARLATGQKPQDSLTVVPSYQLLDSSKMTFDLSNYWIAYPDYQDRFKKIWGVN